MTFCFFHFIYLCFNIIYDVAFPLLMLTYEKHTQVHILLYIWFVSDNVHTILFIHLCVTVSEQWHNEVMYVRSLGLIKKM